MRKTWLVLFAALAAFACAGSVSAQQTVLDSLINVALSNNPELSAATFAGEATAEGARAAGALQDPMLTVGVLNLPANSFSLDRTPMSSVAVGVSQKIPWPGKLSAHTDLADTKVRQSQAAVNVVANRVAREVTNSYSEYSYWSLTEPIIKEYLELLKATREIAEVRYANGNASAQDVLRISSMLSRTDVRLLKTEQKRHASILDLRRAVGVSNISGELTPGLPEPTGHDTTSQSVEDNPTVNNAALRVEQADVDQKLAKYTYWPDFTIGVDYSFRQEVPGDPVRGSDYLTFKVGVNLPLWFFAKQKHDVRAARQMMSAARQRERAVREALTARLHDAQSRLTVTLESLRRYDESILPETDAAVEAARVAYEVGEVDFNALLAAQSDAFESRLERLDLLRQFHRTRAELVELSGAYNER